MCKLVYTHKQVKLQVASPRLHTSIESILGLEGGSIVERACIDDRKGSEESRSVACLYLRVLRWIAQDGMVLDDR